MTIASACPTSSIVTRKRESCARGGHKTNRVESNSAAIASVRPLRCHSAGIVRIDVSYDAMHHAGGGVIGITANGRAETVCTTPSIQAMIQELRLATACASGAHQKSASCVAPSAIVAATHGTIAKLAIGA